MKYYAKSFLALALLGGALLSSCTKSGCIDPSCINYDKSAAKDDGSCIFAGQHYEGEYKVTEEPISSTQTGDLTAKLTKLDKYRCKFEVKGRTVAERQIGTKGTIILGYGQRQTLNQAYSTGSAVSDTLIGEIYDENKFDVIYQDGSGTYVKQTFTRK